MQWKMVAKLSTHPEKVLNKILPSMISKTGVGMWVLVRMWLEWGLFVRLSLLTVTNPNQLCDVLLFVCSKMADETNLSSKLPVADRTREVWGRSSVGDVLALAFRCARFCSASLILFASHSPVLLLMRPRHFVRSCAICSHDSVGM